MNLFDLKPILESLLFSSENPLSIHQLVDVIQTTHSQHSEAEQKAEQKIDPAILLKPENESESVYPESIGLSTLRGQVIQILQELKIEYQSHPERGFELVEVAGGFQFRSKPAFAAYIKTLHQTAPTRLSQAALESLAIVAYRQPVTRAEVDEIRGVDSGGVLRTLLERDLLRVVGKKDEAGKPLLYGTTKTFLETFSLENLQGMPTLKDLKQIEEEMQSQATPQENQLTLPLGQDFFNEEEKGLEDSISSRFSELEEEENEAIAAQG